MHPFTSLTLWALAACTTLILPAQTILPIYSAATFFCLIALKATRRRAKYVVWLMFSLGAGLWLVHGGWLMDVVEIKRHFEVFIRRPGKEVQTAIFRQ